MINKIKASVLLSLVSINFYGGVCYAIENIPMSPTLTHIDGNNNNGNLTVESNNNYNYINGYYDITNSSGDNPITINGNNKVTIKNSAFTEANGIYVWNNGINNVSSPVEVSGGTVHLINCTVEETTFFPDKGTKRNEGGNISGNFAYSAYNSSKATNGTAIIEDVEINSGTTFGINGSFAYSDRGSVYAEGGNVTIFGNKTNINYSSTPNNSYRGIIGSHAFTNENNSKNQSNATAINGKVTISSGTVGGNTYILGNLAYARGNSGGNAYASGGHVIISEDTDSTTNISTNIRGNYARTTSGNAIAENGIVEISGGNITGEVYGGYGLASLSNTTDIINPNAVVTVSNNKVLISGGNINTNLIGGYAANFKTNGKEMTLENNKVILGGNSTVKGNVISAYFRLPYFTSDENFTSVIKNNIVMLTGAANAESADLYGYYISGIDKVKENSGNTLVINNWKGQKINSINNFNSIKFKNINWQNGGVVVEVLNNKATTSLKDTEIDLRGSTTIAGGTVLKKDDYMYFIKSEDNIGTDKDKVLVDNNGESDNIFTAGVALQGTGKVEVEENGNVKYTITDVKTNEQTNIIPVNSSLAAAVVINGNDLVVDGLNSMEQDQLFGVKTFAIVEGNDSSYNVADDIKVNGWNGLYGVGNIKEYNSGNLSYAAFFENGTANYRTFNSFIDEVIRGDGSIVYNGGGIAGRYKKDDGLYTEASLRAGLLKNELKNMFKDGNGNSYGYKTETPYYALHLGVGKIIQTESDKDLDLYARYYYTYNDGDSFTVAGDSFDVDSITSNKIRIGTRYNVNKNNDFSTYYGLAWEYEFDNDSTVVINGQQALTESMQGSSCFAEIGFVQRNSTQWSYEGRVRGYVGEREGLSSLLRATYSF